MSSRNLLNLVLLVIIAILVAVVVYEPGVEKPQPEPVLTNLTEQQVNHIHIKRETGEDIILVKQGDHWQMQAPYQLPANDFRMKSLLRILRAPSHAQHDLGQLSAARFGLEKPRASITFNQQLTINFGNNEPLQHNRYLGIGNKLHLVTDTFYYLVSARATTFLDHNPMAGNQDIVKIQLPGFSVQLNEGKWSIQPQRDDLSADAITNLVNFWRQGQAIEIRPLSSQQAADTVSIWLAGNETPLVFNIIQNKANTLLQRRELGVEYVIANDRAAKLLTLSNTDESEAASEQK